jgi:multidrug efflux pump
MLRGLIARSTTVNLVLVVLTLFGLKVYSELPREAAPDIAIPKVLVITPYVGVSPQDIESLVTVPLESELAGLKDLKKMKSTSAEGASIIDLEFEPDIDIEDALQKVRDRVGRARGKLPPDAEDTDIREISFSDFPIVIVTLAGGVDEEKLKKLGEDLAEDLRRVPGVLDAKLSGGRERQIRVQVDPFRLQHYGLSMNDVIGAIGDENVNIPGGNVVAGDASFLLRVPGEFVVPADVQDVAIKRVGDRPVFVRDVAKVVDSYADRGTYARMNGEPAVSVAVTKRTGANILEIVSAVKETTARRAQGWPEGVSWRALGDQSKRIEDMVADLENGIITALILVVGVILFFMGVRNSLLVALSIPLSMLLSFLMIQLFGMTLNMIVLFSLILALGMLVDNAIVLVENIYRHIEQGEDLVTASVEGTREVAIAVAASTATTVAAFVPLLFWTGLMGEFMGFLPKTVVIVLIASLVVAVGALPVIAARFMRRSDKPARDVTESPWLRPYRRTLELSIQHRYLSAAAGLGSLVFTFAAYGKLHHGVEFFPETEPERATIAVRAPDGTDLEATDAIVRQVERVLKAQENVDVYVAETGVSGGGNPVEGMQAALNQARITVDFLADASVAKKGEKVRVEPTTTTIDRIRAAVQEIPGARITVDKERMGPPVGKPISVEVSGPSFDLTGELAAKVRRELATIEGSTDLSDDYRVGRPELRLRIDRGASKRVGASTRAVAGTVRSAVAGTKASAIRDGEEEYDIVVEFSPEHRGDIQTVLSLRVPGRLDTSPDTFPVPLSAVASYELAGGSGSIRHIDQKMVVTVEGDVSEGFNQNAVQEKVLEYIAAKNPELPSGYFLRLGGANDEQKNTERFLSNAFMIAVALIALVLVGQFNRIDLPLIILASVVLSLVGVLWGLIITGTAFGIMMTGLGVISLAGVVVNNAIVLLDYVEQLRAKGIEVKEALIQAGMTRFRPVLLTAVTTVLGLVPMAVGISYDFRQLRWVTGSSTSQWWGPMAIAVIFGLAFATVLTLVMVPTFYSILDDFDRLSRRIFKRRPAAAATEETTRVEHAPPSSAPASSAGA